MLPKLVSLWRDYSAALAWRPTEYSPVYPFGNHVVEDFPFKVGFMLVFTLLGCALIVAWAGLYRWIAARMQVVHSIPGVSGTARPDGAADDVSRRS